MGGRSSLQKGKRGEREIVSILQPEVTTFRAKNGLPDNIILKRNTLQSHSGGYDIIGLPWLAIEVKFHETYNLSSWWKQTVAQAREDQVPVLFYRKSRVKWRVRMIGVLPGSGPEDQKAVVDISIDAFLAWFRRELPHRADLREEGC